MMQLKCVMVDVAYRLSFNEFVEVALGVPSSGSPLRIFPLPRARARLLILLSSDRLRV